MFTIYFYKTSIGREIVLSFIESLDLETKAKVRNGIRLFQEYGLELLNTQWIKKVNRYPSIYELRIRSKLEVRLLFFAMPSNIFVFVNGFIKKTNKLPQRELLIAIKRTKEFI